MDTAKRLGITKAPTWAWWSGRTLIIHTYEDCTSAPPKWPMIRVRPQHLNWTNLKACKRCTTRWWKENAKCA